MSHILVYTIFNGRNYERVRYIIFTTPCLCNCVIDRWRYPHLAQHEISCVCMYRFQYFLQPLLNIIFSITWHVTNQYKPIRSFLFMYLFILSKIVILIIDPCSGHSETRDRCDKQYRLCPVDDYMYIFKMYQFLIISALSVFFNNFCMERLTSITYKVYPLSIW